MKYKTQLLIMLTIWIVPAFAVWIQQDDSSNQGVIIWTLIMVPLILLVVGYKAVTKKK